MIAKTTKEFQNEVLNNMTFTPFKTENCSDADNCSSANSAAAFRWFLYHAV